MLPAQFVILLVGIGIFVLLVVVAFDVLTLSFEKLGVPPWMTVLIFIASAIGSQINIPIWYSSQVVRNGRRIIRFPGGVWYYVPPPTTQQIVAINVGGAVIPILFSLWLLPRAPFWRTVLAVIVVAVVTHIAATPVPGKGIEMQVWVAPVTAALLGLVLTWGYGAAPLAYIAGTLGTLIGADLTNLGRLGEIGGGVLSIGGAGVFDGVFISGVVAALLSFERPRKPRQPTHTWQSPA